MAQPERIDAYALGSFARATADLQRSKQRLESLVRRETFTTFE
jgi:hypothetical protein